MKLSEATLSMGGHVKLPDSVRDALNLKPGDRLVSDQDEAAFVRLRSEVRQAPRPVSRTGDLSRLPAIARATSAKTSDAVSADPIGDYLIADDERTKFRR